MFPVKDVSKVSASMKSYVLHIDNVLDWGIPKVNAYLKYYDGRCC